jgi:hypothetical protein
MQHRGRLWCTQGTAYLLHTRKTDHIPAQTAFLGSKVGTSIMYQLCDKCKLIHRRSRKANFRIGKLVNIILELSSI